MSEISLTLVLQIKTSIIINGMAKVQQKSEKITAFGGIFFVLDKFDRILSSPSADTVLRGIEELATENISYTAEKTANVYDFNTAEKLNHLLIKLLLATGQLTEGGEYDVDFDHQFLEAEKYDSKRTYKGFDGYSPGVFTIGGLIAYLENRDGRSAIGTFCLQRMRTCASSRQRLTGVSSR